MFLAETLGKFESEVLDLEPSEFFRWLAYFQVKTEYEEEARTKAERKVRAAARARRR